MAYFGRIGAEEQRHRSDAIAVDDGEVQCDVMPADVPGPRQATSRIAEDAHRVVLGMANERGNPTLHSLVGEQWDFQVEDLSHLVCTARAESNVEQRQRFALLVGGHVDQA